MPRRGDFEKVEVARPWREKGEDIFFSKRFCFKTKFFFRERFFLSFQFCCKGFGRVFLGVFLGFGGLMKNLFVFASIVALPRPWNA